MFAHSTAILVAYVLLTGGLMYANTTLFGLGDAKFGSGGWELYWPLWSAFYAPLILCALIAAGTSQMPAGRAVGLLWAFLALILAVMEVSFILDIHWTILIVEWTVLSAVFFLACNVFDSPRRL